ncbi:MAG: bifunctional adenosylcobinamide kinase/adenosylcobinamide-phosphate guanylyltransferase [Chloroflexi bacterium HGW-Chloroflexi-10]|nr:MAG: bifunctional adenosylcobinamide kinase/adenosylcobinamide-phosphate guanylyltransferase [Chloroflexi bacterium HGW-Chloroflexi-10]
MKTLQLTLILGGARSGKSTYAEQLATTTAEKIVFIATAEAGDEEMARRIIRHKAARPAGWQTLEATQQIADRYLELDPKPEAVLLDCITLLVSNILLSFPEETNLDDLQNAVDQEIDGLLVSMAYSAVPWFVVSNEVGLSLVSPYALGRKYTDLLGRANQRLAAAASSVIFMVAGIPMKVK